MSASETRIFSHSSIKTDHAIVSMPKTAWYWLDDLVKTSFPVGGYRALMHAFQKTDSADAFALTLRRKAQEHCETRMGELYSLANDNVPANGYADLKPTPALPFTPDISARLPSCYKLFHFMPHATYLTTVWERRNYHLRG